MNCLGRLTGRKATLVACTRQFWAKPLTLARKSYDPKPRYAATAEISRRHHRDFVYDGRLGDIVEVNCEIRFVAKRLVLGILSIRLR